MDFVKVTVVMLRPASAVAAQGFFPTDQMVQSYGYDRATGLICESMSSWVIEMSRNQPGLCPVKWRYEGVILSGAKLASALARYRYYGPGSSKIFVPIPIALFGPEVPFDEQRQEDFSP